MTPAKEQQVSEAKHTRQLPESRLYAPVAAWLGAQGYKVFAEAWGHDVIGFRASDDRLIGVELKTSLTFGLCTQVSRLANCVDEAYGAIPTTPRKKSLERCDKWGMGLLIVTDGAVSILRQPQRQVPCWHSRRKKMLAALRVWEPKADAIGGVPNLAGTGPAQAACKAIDEYLIAHPRASWRDIFRDVPNHYANHNSMRQAIKEARIRLDRSIVIEGRPS